MFKVFGFYFGLFSILSGVASVSGQTGGENSETPIIRIIAVEGQTRTREAIIRRELLFSEGESLDSTLVAESARNLRRLFFLGQVDI